MIKCFCLAFIVNDKESVKVEYSFQQYLFVIGKDNKSLEVQKLVIKMRFISVLFVSLIIVINVYSSQSQKGKYFSEIPRVISFRMLITSFYEFRIFKIEFPQIFEQNT